MERNPSGSSEEDEDDETLWAVCSSEPECGDLWVHFKGQFQPKMLKNSPSCEVKTCEFVKNQIHYSGVFNFKMLLPVKIPVLYKIIFFQWKLNCPVNFYIEK